MTKATLNSSSLLLLLLEWVCFLEVGYMKLLGGPRPTPPGDVGPCSSGQLTDRDMDGVAPLKIETVNLDHNHDSPATLPLFLALPRLLVSPTRCDRSCDAICTLCPTSTMRVSPPPSSSP